MGVEDDGTITGLNYNKAEISRLLETYRQNIHPDTPLAGPIEHTIDILGHNILYISVDKGTTVIHQTADGKCLQRKDRENRPVSMERLKFERLEQLSREYDRQFIDGPQVTDLNIEIINRISEQLRTTMSPEKCLQYLGLAEYGGGRIRLRRAALLLFATDINKWHPRCQVRIVRVKGTELKTGKEYNVASQEIAQGNILELMNSAWEKLRPHLVETKMTPDAVFREKVMYPEEACREALINAITHRNYNIEGKSIEIYIFDDRMEVNSPGSLLSTITIDELRKLQGMHESRNAFVARVLREIGYVREMGEGMRRIFLSFRNADLVYPELKSKGDIFSMILSYKSVFSDADQKWVEGFKPLIASREEMLVALMGKDGSILSPQQIYERLNLVDWDVYRAIIEPMQIKGVIYNAIPRTQKVNEARRRRVSQRTVPRIVVRPPQDCEVALNELFQAINKAGKTEQINPQFLNQLNDQLLPNNPYRGSVTTLYRLLGFLNLIDASKKPTLSMKNIWGEPRKQVTEIPYSEEKLSIQQLSLFRTPSTRKTVEKYDAVYIGNIDYDTSQDELRVFFKGCGKVKNISIPVDFTTQRGRGFAFVQMSNHDEAQCAVDQLDGKLFKGRTVRVNW